MSLYIIILIHLLNESININININIRFSRKLAYYIHKVTICLKTLLLLDWDWKHDILGHVVTNEWPLLMDKPGDTHYTIQS